MAGGACIGDTTIDSKEQRSLLNDLMTHKNIKKWMKDPFAIELGWTDKESLQWLWTKYTGNKHFDPMTIKLNKTDINIFAKAIGKEFLPSLGKRAGYFDTYFKLPRVLAKGFKGGDTFVHEVGEAVAYNQKLLKDGAKHIKEMTDGMYEMFLDPSHPINKKVGATMSKAEYKKFSKLEKELLLATTTDQKTEALRELRKHVGRGNPNDPLAGQMLRRFNNLLTFKSQPETKAEHKIVQAWDILRLDSMKDLLNGSIAAKRTIEQLLNTDPNKAVLLRAHKKISEQIESLLMQSSQDAKTLTNRYRLENGIVMTNNKRDLMVFDPVTKKKTPYYFTNENGDMVSATGIRGVAEKTITKYSPDYMIELTDIMSNLVQYAKDSANPGYKGASANDIERRIEQALSAEAISNRLKQKGDVEGYGAALDPVYYLTKYVHDVASFNMRARVNHSYANATKYLVSAIRKNEHGNGKIQIAEYSSYLLDLITEIKDSALINNGSPNNSLDNVVRAINGFEYIAKLGFSFKSGIKNRTQALFNWVTYGKRGYRVTEEFYNTSSRMYKGTEVTNRMMVDRQLKRMGMFIGEKAEGANIAAATGGSVDVALIPQGFGVDAQGKLVLEKGSTSKKIAEGIAKGADWSSKYTLIGKIGSQQWAENKNRLNTFEMQFAHSFLAESKRLEFHKKALFERTEKDPTTEQLWDYIEHIAGNQAFEMVKTLHFDYDNWAKARILQRGTGYGAGAVVGQFQHFKFAFFDLQYNILKDMTRDIKGFKFTVEDPIQEGNRMLNRGGEKRIVNPAISSGMRLMSLYSLMPALVALVTDHDVGGIASAFGWTPFDEDKYLADGTMSLADRSSPSGLIENPIVEETKKFLDYVNNWNHDGDEAAQIKHYSAYYGKNPITGNMGPFFSDILTLAELTDFINLTGEEYENHRDLNYDPSNPDWWYQVARIFNIQSARTAWKTFPAIAKGQIHKAFRIETGLYQPKWITKWRKQQVENLSGVVYGSEGNEGIGQNVNILPEIKFRDKKVRKKRMSSEEIRRRALLNLSSFS